MEGGWARECSDGSRRIGGGDPRPRLELGGYAGRLELGGRFKLVKLLQGGVGTDGAAVLAPQLSHLFPTVLHQRLVLRDSQLFTCKE